MPILVETKKVSLFVFGSFNVGGDMGDHRLQ